MMELLVAKKKVKLNLEVTTQLVIDLLPLVSTQN